MSEEIELVIYGVARPEHMAVLFFLASAIGVYVWRKRAYKRWPKLYKVMTLAFVGGVYAADAVLSPDVIEFRIWFRVAMLLLVVGELAYNGDNVANIMEDIVKRLKRDGPAS